MTDKITFSNVCPARRLVRGRQTLRQLASGRVSTRTAKRRVMRFFEFEGRVQSGADWAHEFGIAPEKLHRILKEGRCSALIPAERPPNYRLRPPRPSKLLTVPQLVVERQRQRRFRLRAALECRDLQIVELRAAGMTFNEIGERFGISRQRAQQIVNKQGQRCHG